ncbi:hypothetical protein [Sphingobium subterraneum]|uniref:Uncharacterized protein n=1 Tax=Sphingobium subterraneum TaxID=627688 RepID=A0A841IWM1_9SPHN|nr:hypothetical protein [Sphingobium subterraneum]MBB6122670.1 hypothetical protein [Sphingobium subterraneum]
MADYRNDPNVTVVERRSGFGRTLAIIVVLALIVVGILFATGFWKADVQGGALPDVDVSAKGGALPDVDMQSKEVVVGTKSTSVDVPKIETEKTEIDVPVVGVKDNEK